MSIVVSISDEIKAQMGQAFADILQEEIIREFQEEFVRNTIKEVGFYEFVLKAEFLKECIYAQMSCDWRVDLFHCSYVEVLRIIDSIKK